MKFFEQLGNHVHEAWRAKGFDERAFHDVAVDCMRAHLPSEHVSPDDVIEWVHESRAIVPQFDLTMRFGQPPINVFTSARFVIEVLFWVDSTTAIHQHGFSGAFHVLEGSSLHVQYEFRAEQRYTDRIMTGQLEVDRIEHLHKGDVRAIQSGSALIHSLFHLDRPSVSVVVRTVQEPFAGPQYRYERSGVAWDPFFTTDLATRQLQTLELLLKLERPNFLKRAQRTIEASDPLTAFLLLDWLLISVPQEQSSSVLDSLRSPHTDLIKRIRARRDDQMWETALIDLRKRIRSAEHRFFLALLLNLPNRKHIVELVREAFPGAPPTETIVRWVSELSQTYLDDGKNALEIPLDESALRVFAHLVDGATDDQVMARLREEFDDVDDSIEDVRELCAAFRKSIFRTLLTS
jgi:hypothetical protein